MFLITDQSTNELIGFIRARRHHSQITFACVYPCARRKRPTVLSCIYGLTVGVDEVRHESLRGLTQRVQMDDRHTVVVVVAVQTSTATMQSELVRLPTSVKLVCFH